MTEFLKSPVLSVAPMMDRTDRHCRYFLRQLAPGVQLYTEMITAQAIVHGDRGRLLAFHPLEHPVALQLGGSDPELLATATRAGCEAGYDEINLNLGCPSDRVQAGRFGACLMREPALVADCLAAMCAASVVPVSVKTRIGVDEYDSEEELAQFIGMIVRAGVCRVVIHARKAILSGLSPKQNREIPPLRYEMVYRIKAAFPDVTIHLNGGVRDLDSVATHLSHVDGVMIGRKAYEDPWFLVAARQRYLPDPGGPVQGCTAPTREAVVAEMLRYARQEAGTGVRLASITRHMAGLYRGQPGARLWRRALSEGARTIGPDALLRELQRLTWPQPAATAA